MVMTTALDAPEARVRRTHARRSCNLCKLRKTRCELPDLDVPSSSTPLPEDKACHRCRVLSQPCVVDDSRLKKRRRRDNAQPAGTQQSSKAPGSNARGASSASSTKRHSASIGDNNATASTSRTPNKDTNAPKRTRRTSTSGTRPGDETTNYPTNLVNHAIDFSAAYPISTDAPNGGGYSTSGAPATAAEPVPPDNGRSGRIMPRSVRLHGRPLSLTAAMLSVAGRKMYDGLRRRIPDSEDMVIGELVDHALRVRLAPAYAKLRVFHPHLQSMSEMFGLIEKDPDDTAIQLLVATSLYVSAVALGDDSEGQKLRGTLASFIYTVQHLILAQQPQSFHAIQALEILSLHAPFAPALPLQNTDPRTLAPSRGIINAANNISNALNFNDLISISVIDPWTNPDFWLWVGLRAAEAQMALEDERPRKPAGLSEARNMACTFAMPDHEPVWASSATNEDPSELVGKLVLIDRLARLEELHDAIGRLRNALDMASTVPNYNAIQAVVDEFDYFTTRMSSIDVRYEDILAMLRIPQELLSGIRAYRGFRRRWEEMKEHMMSFQTLVALHFLPGSGCAVGALPTSLSPGQAVHYALHRANDPEDILYAYAASTLATEEIRRSSRLRGELAEQQLQAYLEFSNSGIMAADTAKGTLSDIVPHHEIFALVVESAKILMEMHASRLTFLKSIYSLPRSVATPRWVDLLERVSDAFRSITVLAGDHFGGTSGDGSRGGGEYIANGCSNLVGSMVRTVQSWAEVIERDGAAAAAGGLPRLPHALHIAGVSPTPAPKVSILTHQPHVPGFQRYMPTSDRWLADETESSASGAAIGSPSTSLHPPTADFGPPQSQAQPQALHLSQAQAQCLPPQHPPPPNFDHTLSQMFGYGYDPALAASLAAVQQPGTNTPPNPNPHPHQYHTPPTVSAHASTSIGPTPSPLNDASNPVHLIPQQGVQMQLQHLEHVDASSALDQHALM